MISHYVYETRLEFGCELFGVEPFKSSAKNIGEMIISSKWFDDYQPCAQNAIEMLDILKTFLDQLTNERFVVMSQINPHHDPTYLDKSDISETEWPQNVIMKMFIVNSDKLKRGEVAYTISSVLSVVHENLNLIHSRSGRFTQ